MSPIDPAQRDLRRQNILRRWPRFHWDSFGRPRLQVWTTSFLGLTFGLFALFPSIFFELYLRGEKLGSLPFAVFASTPVGRVALAAIVLFGAEAGQGTADEGLSYNGVRGLLIGLLRALTSLLTRAPMPWLAAMEIGATLSFCFLVVAAIAGVPAPGSRMLVVGRELGKFVFLGSPLAGFLFGHLLLHPFRPSHLFDRRLSRRVRAVLASLAVPAALPLGGLAVPAWILLRHFLGPKLDRPAAQLRVRLIDSRRSL